MQQVISIGDRYTYRPIAGEGCSLTYYQTEEVGSGQWEILHSVREPLPLEVKGILGGEITLSLVVLKQIPYICWRSELIKHPKGFGVKEKQVAIPWQECSFTLSGANNADRNKLRIEFNKILADLKGDSNLRPLVPLICVNFSNFQVVALQVFTIPNQFAIAFLEAVLDNNFSSKENAARISEIESVYPVGTMASRAVLTCRAGE